MMQKTTLRKALLGGLLLAPVTFIGGCSLTNVVDIKVGECPSADEAGDKACQDVLNPEHGFYDGCAAFKCVEKDKYFQCQKVEGEICDGQDNDCDYLIDEPASDHVLLQATSRDVVSGVNQVQSLSLAASDKFGRSLYLQEDAATLKQIALDGDGTTQSSVSLQTQKANPDPRSQTELTKLTEGCYRSSGAELPGTCVPQQNYTAAGANVAFFAYVDGKGCSSGELRVGVIEQATPSEFIDRGLGSRDPTYRGVATYGSRCSDNGTSQCAALKSQSSPADAELPKKCGVSEPMVAALPKQALVAFLGTQLGASTCPSSDINVLALALHASSDSFVSTFYWSNPSGDGVPDVLGKTRSGARPGVIALAETGFVVAHGAVAGGVQLLWVPTQETPAKTDGTSCPQDDCESRDGLETKPLSGTTELTKLSTNKGEIDDGVGLSVLNISDTNVALLVTWLAGCAIDNASNDLPAYAQLLHLDISGKTPEIVDTFPILSLGKSRRAPLAVTANDDFVVAGLKRNGQRATTELAGGFFVFTESTSTHIVRVAAFDGALVDESESIKATGWQYELALEPGTTLAHDSDHSKLKSVTVACSK